MGTAILLHDHSDADLVLLCLQHHRSAWEEFFRRFSPLMKKAIRRTFIQCKAGYMCDDIDIIMDIHAVLVEKLYARGALHKCPDTSGIHSWLAVITANETYDWLRRKKRIKNLPMITEEQLLLSLSKPLGEDDDSSLLDMIADEGSDIFALLHKDAIQHYAESILGEISHIANLKNRWVLRLSILGQLSLSGEELNELRALSPLSGDVLESRINDVELSLAGMERNRQDNLGKCVLYWHQQRAIERNIDLISHNTFSNHAAEIDALEEEWNGLERRKNALFSSCLSLPRPSNKELAELLGIPEQNSGDVSQYLSRARKELRLRMKKLSDT